MSNTPIKCRLKIVYHCYQGNTIKQKVLGWLKLFIYLFLKGQDSPLLYCNSKYLIMRNVLETDELWVTAESINRLISIPRALAEI